ncbi:MAG: hypothetical protein WBQ60_11610, partial [Asticcacaulis sp.]
DWIVKKEPEVTIGRSLFTGFDIDNPLMRDVWGKILRKTGRLTRGKKVTQLGYILSNEPHWYAEAGFWTQKYKEMNSISSYTLNNFRGWLGKKYESRIADLNQNWGASFAGFDTVEIVIPINRAKQGTPIWYDWSRYNMDRGTDWFTYLQGELHEANPDADTHIKIMPHLFTDDPRSHGIDLEALTELTTMIGDDAQATAGPSLKTGKREKWQEHYAYKWGELGLSYDFMESVSPKKIHINSEAHFLSTSSWRELDTSPDYVRSVFWLATLQGMDASMSWFWARDPDGSPEDRLEGELNFFDPALAGSYAGSVNMQPQVANEVTQVMIDLNSVSEDIMALRAQRRPLRLFYTEASAINKSNHMTQQTELYEALFFEGFPMGFATANILTKQDHNQWDTVLVYKTEYATHADMTALQAYLDKGGTVILDATSLTKNEYGVAYPTRLTAGTSGKLIRLESTTSLDEIKAKALASVENGCADVTLMEDNGTPFKGCHWRVVKTQNGHYLMNILNLGKNDAKLKLGTKTGKSVRLKNILTGETFRSAFDLKSKGVLLLDVTTR